MKELKLDFKPRFNKMMGIYSRKGITGTFLASGGSHGEMAGSKAHQYYHGKGLEFDGYREYTPQDDAKMIDWKATLRANKKLVRLFNEEKNKNIIFLFDVSSSMCFGSHNKLKVEYAAELIGSLAFSYQATGDSVGLIMFSDGLQHRRKPSVGEPQWVYMCEDMRNPAFYEGNFNMSKSLKEFMGFFPGEAVIFLVTDFIGVEKDEEWEKYYEVMCAKFEVLTLVIRDPYDNNLPKGLGEVAFGNPFKKDSVSLDVDHMRDKYNEYNAKALTNLKEFCESHQSDFIMLETDKDFVKPVLNFLIRREMIWK
jgi:uncharacterized protein (DUF58 family)